MITVTLRKELSKKKDKIYLYLDFYPPIFNPKTRKSSRRQYLHMFLYPKPQNDVQRNYNEAQTVLSTMTVLISPWKNWQTNSVLMKIKQPVFWT